MHLQIVWDLSTKMTDSGWHHIMSHWVMQLSLKRFRPMGINQNIGNKVNNLGI